MKDFLIKIFASVFGLGYLPVAPGTWGTFGTLLLWYFFLRKMDTHLYMILVGIIIVFSIYISGLANKVYDEKDNSHIVIDELCGFLVSMIGINMYAGAIYWGIAGFLLFRFFDILKPPPVRFMERFPGGVGVVMDDIAAGVYGAIILNVVIYFVSPGIIMK